MFCLHIINIDKEPEDTIVCKLYFCVINFKYSRSNERQYPDVTLPVYAVQLKVHESIVI